MASTPAAAPIPSWRGARRRERVPAGRRRRASDEAARRKISETAIGLTPPSFFLAGISRQARSLVREERSTRPPAMSSRKVVSERRRTGSSASGRRSDSVQPRGQGLSHAAPAHGGRRKREQQPRRRRERASRGQAERGFKGGGRTKLFNDLRRGLMYPTL